jgi:catechol 2,3-dioxygenase-like lactoylglutathione lyase family enzyme
MLDHIILNVSDVKRSLAFYEEALMPLGIKFFLPYKGEGGHPDTGGYRSRNISASHQVVVAQGKKKAPLHLGNGC